MLAWIKDNMRGVVTVIVTILIGFWLYSCESQVKSLDGTGTLINRAELQLELDRFMGMAELRMADLDRQDAFRTLIIENSLLLVQGTPFNPVGIITAIAGIYGVTHGASKVVRRVRKGQEKRKANNG